MRNVIDNQIKPKITIKSLLIENLKRNTLKKYLPARFELVLDAILNLYDTYNINIISEKFIMLQFLIDSLLYKGLFILRMCLTENESSFWKGILMKVIEVSRILVQEEQYLMINEDRIQIIKLGLRDIINTIPLVLEMRQPFPTNCQII